MNFPIIMGGFVALAVVLAFLAWRKEIFASLSGGAKNGSDPASGRDSRKGSKRKSTPVPVIMAMDLRNMLAETPAPVAVLFFSPKCPGCHTMEPLFQEAADAHEGDVRFVRINVLDNRSTARRVGIARIPTLMVFKGSDEAPLNSHIGKLDPSEIERFINDAVSSDKG